MKMQEIMQTIKELASSQGYYSRLYYSILALKENNKKYYNEFKKELENQNFQNAVDLVMYLEG